MSQPTISKIERIPGSGDDATLDAIARALGVSRADLSIEEPTPPQGDAHVIPTMAAVPGWNEVLARARAEDPTIDEATWQTLEQSPGLLAFHVALTPALLVDLARVVRRHRPPKR